jgi:radical SAM superfamily enzyme YgiQ (UPF0313 family)
MLIQSNVKAPCTLLDFPTLDRFVEELRGGHYDVVGISGIIPNLTKVKAMCALVRQHLPHAKIVVGGHIANIPDLAEQIDVDYVVKGDGVRWFRKFLGEDPEQSIRHPQIVSGLGTRNVGMTVGEQPGQVAATVIPSVGCPLGCNFCSTSAMFGGKGHSVSFYRTGDELFEIMSQLEASMKVQSFFMMDENFLFDRKRALRLLELMEQHQKSWALYVFSSANVLRSYRIEQLVALGVSWVWMGLEGKDSQYAKLHGIDALDLVRKLQSHGIRVLGSTIIGLENHTPENIDEAIDHAVRYDTEFHQFMLYTPIPGTPLYAELSAQGRIKEGSEFDPDIHGQLIFNYRHPHLPAGTEGEIMLRAFRRDFEVNGPSVVRIVRTMLAGWKRHKNHPDPRIRRRFAWEVRELRTTFSALVAAARRYYRGNPAMRAKMDAILRDLYREFGLKSRFFAALGGRLLFWSVRREERRLARGWTYEPPTFYEQNEAAQRSAAPDSPKAALCRAVACRARSLPIATGIAAPAEIPDAVAVA